MISYQSVRYVSSSAVYTRSKYELEADLYYAIREGNINNAKKALNNGVNLNWSNNGEVTHLMYAASHATTPQRKEIFNEVLKYNPDLNRQDEDGRTALMHAIKNNCTEAALALIDKGADLEIRDKNGMNAFRYAFAYRNNKVRAAILDHKPLASGSEKQEEVNDSKTQDHSEAVSISFKSIEATMVTPLSCKTEAQQHQQKADNWLRRLVGIRVTG